MQKNKPFKGSTKEWTPGSTTITGQYPNRALRKANEKILKGKKPKGWIYDDDYVEKLKKEQNADTSGSSSDKD